MVKVLLTGGLAAFADGETEVEVTATNVRDVIRALQARFPAMGPWLEDGMAVAIDGEIHQDALFSPVKPDSEVCFLPRIGGG